MIIFLIAILAAAFILYAVVEGGSRQKKGRRRSGGYRSGGGGNGHVDAAEIRIRWQTVMATSKTGASGLKSSLNEADKLLDYVMRQKGYPGDTMGERLKIACRDMTDRDGVWRAHKLRNALAHEVGFDLVVSQVNDALREFEHALKDLGAL